MKDLTNPIIAQLRFGNCAGCWRRRVFGKWGGGARENSRMSSSPLPRCRSSAADHIDGRLRASLEVKIIPAPHGAPQRLDVASSRMR